MQWDEAINKKESLQSLWFAWMCACRCKGVVQKSKDRDVRLGTVVAVCGYGFSAHWHTVRLYFRENYMVCEDCINGALVQFGRTFDLHSKGRGFESPTLHQTIYHWCITICRSSPDFLKAGNLWRGGRVWFIAAVLKTAEPARVP